MRRTSWAAPCARTTRTASCPRVGRAGGGKFRRLAGRGGHQQSALRRSALVRLRPGRPGGRLTGGCRCPSEVRHRRAPYGPLRDSRRIVRRARTADRARSRVDAGGGCRPARADRSDRWAGPRPWNSSPQSTRREGQGERAVVDGRPLQVTRMASVSSHTVPALEPSVCGRAEQCPARRRVWMTQARHGSEDVAGGEAHLGESEPRARARKPSSP